MVENDEGYSVRPVAIGGYDNGMLLKSKRPGVRTKEEWDPLGCP